jgi:hypothetical protein
MDFLARWLPLAAIALVPVSLLPEASPAWLQVGKPDITTAAALSFTPEGLLLVGDSPAAALFALDVRDTAAAMDTVTVANIDARIAAKLGVAASDIAINDMAVHPTSHAIYLAVTRGRGTARRPTIIRAGKGGRLDIVSLERIPFAKASLPDPPAPGSKDEDGADASDQAITGIAVANGAVYVAGLSGAQAATTLRRIAIPFTSSIASTTLTIYHAHHSKFESRSPITALTSYVSGGKTWLIGGLGCTPITMFPLDSVTDGAHISGKTIAELGAGTHAASLVNFDWKGRRYLAVATPGRSVQIMPADSLAEAKALGANDNPGRQGVGPIGSWYTWGVPAYPGAVSGILRLADFNADYGVALQRAVESGVLYLRPLQKPIFWGNHTTR